MALALSAPGNFHMILRKAIRLGGFDRVVSLSSVASAICVALATAARK